MNTKDKVLLWLIAAVFAGFFIHLVKPVLLPFVVAMIVSYFLDPATDRIEKMGASRTIATLVVTGLFFTVFIVASILLAPLLYDQFLAMLHAFPKYIDLANETLLPSFSHLIEKIDPSAIEKDKESVSEVASYVFSFLTRIIGGIWDSGLAVVNLLSLLFVTPIVTFYMLRDWDRMIARINGWLPKKNAAVIQEQIRLIDRTLSGYIRGQTNVCLLLGVFYAIGLTLTGLDFGLFIGLGTGILAFIPYVGLLIGMTAGLLVAFFQFGDIFHVGLVALVFVVGQFIEGNFVTPKLVGDKVGLHPVWIIFGMLAGASIFGFVGILVAVPITAIIGVLARFSIDQYMKSSLYLGNK